MINDVNDHHPEFPDRFMTVPVLENTTYARELLVLDASDADSGLFGQVSYTIADGNSQHFFEIVSDRLQLRSGLVLDREHTDLFNLTIVSEDQGVPPLNASAYVSIRVVDLNDNDPVFDPTSLRMEIAENSPQGVLVGRLRASDVDLVGSNLFFTFRRAVVLSQGGCCHVSAFYQTCQNFTR